METVAQYYASNYLILSSAHITHHWLLFIQVNFVIYQETLEFFIQPKSTFVILI